MIKTLTIIIIRIRTITTPIRIKTMRKTVITLMITTMTTIMLKIVIAMIIDVK